MTLDHFNLIIESKLFINHIFAFLLAGSTLLLYIATLFPLNQFGTSFFKFSHFKESNYQTDMEALLEFFTASKQTAKCSSIGRSGNEGDFRGKRVFVVPRWLSVCIQVF